MFLQFFLNKSFKFICTNVLEFFGQSENNLANNESFSTWVELESFHILFQMCFIAPVMGFATITSYSYSGMVYLLSDDQYYFTSSALESELATFRDIFRSEVLPTTIVV
jgi:hypothetical protein